MTAKLEDYTEGARRLLQHEINSNAQAREVLEKAHGQVWDTAELQKDFTVLGFAAPYVLVQRKSDGKKGSLLFQHDPRFYWGFEE